MISWEWELARREVDGANLPRHEIIGIDPIPSSTRLEVCARPRTAPRRRAY